MHFYGINYFLKILILKPFLKKLNLKEEFEINNKL